MIDFNRINKETYNKIAYKYIAEAELDHNDKGNINHFIETFNGKRVLDLGCGTGVLSKYLADLGYDVTGVDFSEEMIKISKSLLPNNRFIVEDVLNINGTNELFNGIIAAHLLIHFNRKQVLELLMKIRRLMAIDSSLFIQFVPHLQEGLQIESLDNSCQLYRYNYDSLIISELLDKTGYEAIYNETNRISDYDVTTMIAKVR